MSRRRKTADYVGAHEVDVFPYPLLKRFRVRIYEYEADVPVILISTSDDPVHAVALDIERIAAEIVLRKFPERALGVGERDEFVHVVEHLPKSYDICKPKENRKDQFCLVEFDDYRIRVGRRPWRVRNVEKALGENTKAGNERVTFGYPRWRSVEKEEVEEMVGMTLDDTLDISLRVLPSDLPDIRLNAEAERITTHLAQGFDPPTTPAPSLAWGSPSTPRASRRGGSPVATPHAPRPR